MRSTSEAAERATAETRIEIRRPTNKRKFIEAFVLAIRPIGGSDLQHGIELNESTLFAPAARFQTKVPL